VADAPKRRSRAAGTETTESVKKERVHAKHPSKASSTSRAPRKRVPSSASRPPWTFRDVLIVVGVLAVMFAVAIPEMDGGLLLPPTTLRDRVLVGSGGWVGLALSVLFLVRSRWFRGWRERLASDKSGWPWFLILFVGLSAVGYAAGLYTSHRLGPQWGARLGGESRVRPALLLGFGDHPTRRRCVHPAVVSFVHAPQPIETCFLDEATRSLARPGDTLLMAVHESAVFIQIDKVLALRKVAP
jgi:hypothetical protein